MQDTVIVGAVVSGERAEVQKAIKRLVKQVNTNLFDIAELLYKAQSKHLYTEPTFTEFAANMGLKKRKAQYLERIAEVMTLSNIERAEYEPIGIAKLRAITRLHPLTKEGAVNIWKSCTSEPIETFITDWSRTMRNCAVAKATIATRPCSLCCQPFLDPLAEGMKDQCPRKTGPSLRRRPLKNRSEGFLVRKTRRQALREPSRR